MHVFQSTKVRNSYIYIIPSFLLSSLPIVFPKHHCACICRGYCLSDRSYGWFYISLHTTHNLAKWEAKSLIRSSEKKIIKAIEWNHFVKALLRTRLKSSEISFKHLRCVDLMCFHRICLSHAYHFFRVYK